MYLRPYQTFFRQFKHCFQLFYRLWREGKWSRSVVSDSWRPRGLSPTGHFHARAYPGKSTGVGRHCLLQRIFPSQGLHPGLPHCRQTLYHLSHKGSPKKKSFNFIEVNKITFIWKNTQQCSGNGTLHRKRNQTQCGKNKTGMRALCSLKAKHHFY